MSIEVGARVRVVQDRIADEITPGVGRVGTVTAEDRFYDWQVALDGNEDFDATSYYTTELEVLA